MDFEEIKKRLVRPATKFSVGGFRPTHANDESWLGKVFLFRPDEGIPRNVAGEEMLPYAQFHLPNLPFISPALKGIRLLTLFVSKDFPEAFEPMGSNWLIREYSDLGVLVRKELSVADSFLNAFALKAELMTEDYPLWDGGGVPADLEDEIVRLEEAGVIEDYSGLLTHTYEHKIGGYPSFCQSGVEVGDDFEFVFQISSDEKLNLNVVDSGCLMFWKNRNTGEWVIYYDFF